MKLEMEMKHLSEDDVQRIGNVITETSLYVRDFFIKNNSFDTITLEMFVCHMAKIVVCMRVTHNLENGYPNETGINTIKETMEDSIKLGIKLATEEFERNKQ